jgi:deazaflavin-dependent oxidoreductase (nitroreductase family)
MQAARAATPPPKPLSVPWYVPKFGGIVKALLHLGVPLGFNRLITIRGRTSGQLRTTPVAVLDYEGRRWVWSPWGDSQWVRNLRAAGEATITIRRHDEDVTATELDAAERVTFFRDVLAPFARSFPFGVTFIRVVDGGDLRDPVAAAQGRRVFQLRPRSSAAFPPSGKEEGGCP